MEESRVVKKLKECQPFRDGAATLVCVGCFKMLVFPAGSQRVRCGHCSTVTDGIAVKCTACHSRIKVPLSRGVAQCRHCGYSFRPMAKLKVSVPEAKRSVDVIVPLTVRVVIDPSVPCTSKVRDRELKLLPHQPLQTSADLWSEVFGATFSRVGFFKGGKKLSAARTPRELDLADGDVIDVKEVTRSHETGHEFVVAHFGQPTSCCFCKGFIWGIYRQGKRCAKCHAPVHHRCAAKFTATCEANLRQMFGIVNFNTADDEGAAEPVLGVVVDDEDKMEFAANVQEAVEPECAPNFLEKFDKLGGFTDEEIQGMWLRYDVDSSGFLDHAEAKLFLIDLLRIAGVQSVASADEVLEETVERFLRLMDLNGDGVIEWEEFWAFLKAQQDSQFLMQFRGVNLSTQQLYELWYHYDADGSGTLEAEELLALFSQIAQLRGDTAAKFASGTLASFLTPGAKVTWEQFYNEISPVLQAALHSAA